MQDAWRAYLELALGLTEASRKKAQQVVRDVVGKGEATAAQVQAATGELVSTSKANREALTRLVRYEVDRALGAVGLATSEEVDGLVARVQDVERRLRRVEDSAAGSAPESGETPAKKRVKKTAKKTVKKTAKKAPATKSGGSKATSKATTAKKAGGTTAKKTA